MDPPLDPEWTPMDTSIQTMVYVMLQDLCGQAKRTIQLLPGSVSLGPITWSAEAGVKVLHATTWRGHVERPMVTARAPLEPSIGFSQPGCQAQA